MRRAFLLFFFNYKKTKLQVCPFSKLQLLKHLQAIINTIISCEPLPRSTSLPLIYNLTTNNKLILNKLLCYRLNNELGQRRLTGLFLHHNGSSVQQTAICHPVVIHLVDIYYVSISPESIFNDKFVASLSERSSAQLIHETSATE